MSLRSNLAFSSCSHGTLVRSHSGVQCRYLQEAGRLRYFRCLPQQKSKSTDTSRIRHGGSSLPELFRANITRSCYRSLSNLAAKRSITHTTSPYSDAHHPVVSSSTVPEHGDLYDDTSVEKKIRKYVSVGGEEQDIQATPRKIERSWFVKWDSMMDQLWQARRTLIKERRELFREHHVFAQAFLKDLTAEQVQQKWRSLSDEDKLTNISYLLVGSFVTSIEQSLFVLTNIDFPFGEHQIRIQCLSYLQTAFKALIMRSTKLKDDFQNQIARCRTPDTWPKEQLRSRHLKLLLQWSNPAENEVVIRDFFAHYPFPQPDSYSVILDNYIQSGDVSGALQFLPKLPEELLRQADSALKRTLETLLAHDTVITTENGTNFRVLPRILELGVQPDQQMYNLVLQNAMRQDLHNVSWDLYEYLRSQNIEVEARCYSMLLRDAFTRGYVQGLNKVMTDIHESEILRRDPYLIVYSMNIVRVISFYELKASASEAFTRLMGLYDRAWNRERLLQFRIFSMKDGPTNNVMLPHPPPASLAFTLWTFILVQRSERIVDNLWQRIVKILGEADSITKESFRLDIVYNGFVLFYARKLGTLVQALKVVQHMLDSDLCAPTPTTWSLLVCGFLKHHQIDQAANVVRMMKARGLELEYISEQHMPHGYSREELGQRAEMELDETQLPKGLEALLACSESEPDLAATHLEHEVLEDLQRGSPTEYCV